MLSDTERTGLLAELLRKGWEHGKPVSTMTVTDALDEMLAWLTDPRPFSGHSRRAWLSVELDFRASLRSCGPQVRKLLDPHIKEFDMGQAIGRAKQSEDLEPDRLKIRVAGQQLSSDAGMLASWRDIVDSTAREDLSVVRVRFRELNRIIERRGIEIEHGNPTAAGVLFDQLLDVERASRAVGDSVGPDDRDIERCLGERAGLSFQERVDLVGRFLCVGDEDADYCVWLGIERASLSGWVNLNVGTIRFFSGRWIAGVLEKPIGERGDEPPPEILTDQWSKNWLPQDEFVVLARVDMGVRSGSFVSRDARRRLVTLLAPSDRRYPNDWKVLPGHIVYRDGESVSHSAFDNFEETPTHRRLEGIADDWLRDDALALERLLSSPMSLETERFLGLYEWDVAHRTGDSLATVLLAVRTIETVSMSFLGGLGWNDLVRSYASHFAWSQLGWELADVARHVLYSYERNPLEVNRQRLREIFLDVTSHRRNATTTNLDRFVHFVPEIRLLWTDAARHQVDEVIVERMVRIAELDDCLATWTNVDVFSARLAQAVAGIELEIDRLVRLRNAAQHGGPILNPSVDGAVSMVNRARGQILVDVLGVMLKGQKPDAVLDSLARLDGERRRVLQQTDSPITALAVVTGAQ